MRAGARVPRRASCRRRPAGGWPWTPPSTVHPGGWRPPNAFWEKLTCRYFAFRGRDGKRLPPHGNTLRAPTGSSPRRPQGEVTRSRCSAPAPGSDAGPAVQTPPLKRRRPGRWWAMDRAGQVMATERPLQQTCIAARSRPSACDRQGAGLGTRAEASNTSGTSRPPVGSEHTSHLRLGGQGPFTRPLFAPSSLCLFCSLCKTSKVSCRHP